MDRQQEHLVNALRSFQKTYHEYEENKAKQEQDDSAVRIQRTVRKRMARKRLEARFNAFKRARRDQAKSAIRGFTFEEAKYRCESYRLLIRMIGADLSFQDILCEILTAEMMQGLHADLFSDSHQLRNLASHFLLELCHNHKGNQRLLCTTNGITIGNIRLLGVSAFFEKQYQEWCKQHGIQSSYEGTISFLEGVVRTSFEYYKNLQGRDKCHLRNSVFTYPWASMYSELDPHTCLIGVTMDPVLPRALQLKDQQKVEELFRLFQDAAKVHGDPDDMLDSLVPSVPLYSLLVAIREWEKAGCMSRTMRLFLGPEDNVVELGKLGKVEDFHEVSHPAIQKLSRIPISNKVLHHAAAAGTSVLWAPVAAKYTRFVLERRISKKLGKEFIPQLTRFVERNHLKPFDGTDSRGEETGALKLAGYLRRRDLVRIILAGGLNNEAVNANSARLAWEILGPLQDEDFEFCQTLANFYATSRGDFGIRTRIQSLVVEADCRHGPQSRFGSGNCNWDWISRDEMLSIFRDILLPDLDEDGNILVAKGRRKIPMRPLREKSSGVWAPTKVGQSARRAKILQKQLREMESLGSRNKQVSEVNKLCIEQELVMLSQALGNVNPILSLAHLGFPTRSARSTSRATQQPKHRQYDLMSDDEKGNPEEEEQEQEQEQGQEQAQQEGESEDRIISNTSVESRENYDEGKKGCILFTGLTKSKDDQDNINLFTGAKIKAYWSGVKSRNKAHAERCRRILQDKHEAEEKRSELQAKMRIKWAMENVHRENEKKHREKQECQRKHRDFEAKLRKAQEKEDQEQLEKALLLQSKTYCQNEDHTDEQVNTVVGPSRARMVEFDSLVRLRNQLIFNPPEGTDTIVTSRESHPLSLQAEKAAPMWALCKETKRRKAHRKREMRGPAHAPDSLAAQLQKARQKEVRYTSVAGYVLKTKDVEEIVNKQYTIEEIKESCKNFGNDKIPSRQAFLVAQHQSNKKALERVLGMNLDKIEVKIDMLAELQSDEVQRPVASVADFSTQPTPPSSSRPHSRLTPRPHSSHSFHQSDPF